MKSIIELQEIERKHTQEARKIQTTINAIKEKELIPKLEKEYAGRYFVFRNSNGNASWNLYRKILKVKWATFFGTDETPHVDVVVFEFECYPDEYGGGTLFDVRSKGEFPLDVIGTEITQKQFYKAWDDMIKKLEALRK